MDVAFGCVDEGIADGLAIRHDHGGAYLSGNFQRELSLLRMVSPPGFVRQPEGNGCAERFIRTLEEQLLWSRTFATAADLVEAPGEFKREYNERWLIGRHGHRTLSQVRHDLGGGDQAAA
jgi:putative transposase